jgi:hypothetical protein
MAEEIIYDLLPIYIKMSAALRVSIKNFNKYLNNVESWTSAVDILAMHYNSDSSNIDLIVPYVIQAANNYYPIFSWIMDKKEIDEFKTYVKNRVIKIFEKMRDDDYETESSSGSDGEEFEI